MSKIVEDAQALAEAATNLVTEVEAEESGTVGDKTVTKVTVTYSDGSSVDFSPAGDVAGGTIDSSAPVAQPVNDTTDTAETPNGTTDPSTDQQPVELPEGAAEVPPAIAGEIPQSE